MPKDTKADKREEDAKAKEAEDAKAKEEIIPKILGLEKDKKDPIGKEQLEEMSLDALEEYKNELSA